jgi:spore coat polysaccharide biosynthesis protein SpsF
MHLKTVAIIQARLGSTRLPRKVLLPLAGRPMLAHVVERVRRATRVDEVLVATTTNPADHEIVELCNELGCSCFRGDEHDVLDRYFQATKASAASTVVRITSDCPLIDPTVIDQVLDALVESAADYASNIAPRRTFPRGLDTEAFTAATLERCWRDATEPSSREHVTAFIYRHPERFRLECVSHSEDCSAHRWTVDTPEDYALIERIYRHFGHNLFGWKDVLTLLESHPDWVDLNADVPQKTH